MENWKNIPGWEGLYEVSNLGRVRSLRSGGRAKNGVLTNVRRADGYYAVNLTRGPVRKMMAVHRLVLLAFVGPIPTGMHGSHLDGDKTNNALANLAIESASQNCRRRAEHGTQARNRGGAKLTMRQAEQIRTLRREGWKQKDLAKRFAITQGAISRVLTGETWAS